MRAPVDGSGLSVSIAKELEATGSARDETHQ